MQMCSDVLGGAGRVQKKKLVVEEGPPLRGALSIVNLRKRGGLEEEEDCTAQKARPATKVVVKETRGYRNLWIAK